MRVLVHTAWASVLLFGLEGNTRASECGTARLQSRFFCMYMPSRLSRFSTNPILSRSRSACAPRTPSLFKDKICKGF